MSGIKITLNKKLVFSMFMLYFLINLIFLTKFPFVHSDEPWLSGLSRNILENNDFSVTETFFDLYPRHPHAIKSLFHFIQIGFLRVLGYHIFTFRLISLIFGTLTLFFFYKLCCHLLKSEKFALLSAFLLSIDVQFIYASHFARQEVILLFVLTVGLLVFMKNPSVVHYSRDIIIGILIGMSIGIHPNSFIISLPFGALYLYHIFMTRKLKVRNLVIYIVLVTLFAVFFVLLSYRFDPDFLNNYTEYGNQFGVLNPVTSKVHQIKDFYSKLYYGISGTYYTPSIKFQFYLFALVILLSFFKLFLNKDTSKKEIILSIILVVLSVNIGIIFVGRFNATSIIFLFPPCYLLTVLALKDFNKRRTVYAVFIAITLIVTTTNNVLPYMRTSYSSYLNEIGKVVARNSTVLANLNSEYYFNNGKLYDYRNLAFLDRHHMSFSDYMHTHKIEYIIYSDEMDFIYNTRPVWNGLYGNLYYYYEDMQDFIKTKCTLVHEFKDSVYGIRIARYINKRDWWVKIYKVKE